MDPILLDIYSTIVPSAPYLIAAYVLLWAALFAFMLFIWRKVKKAESQIELLEEAAADEQQDQQPQ